MYIREYKTTDEKQVLSLLEYLESCEREGYNDKNMPSYPSNWVRKVSDNGFVFVDDNNIVGYIGYNLRFNNSICFIHDIVTDKNYHNKGIGKKLFTHLSEYLKDKYSTAEIRLDVRSNNDAIRFYEKLGFTPFKVSMSLSL